MKVEGSGAPKLAKVTCYGKNGRMARKGSATLDKPLAPQIVRDHVQEPI